MSIADVSKRWEQLLRREFGHIDGAFLDTFRAPGPANRFVAWDPGELSQSYFKFLLFNTAQKQSAAFFKAYKALRHRDVGRPLTVRCGGCDIDADYLAAVEEWEFLHDAGALAGVRTVVEIGAGFGRTCHALLTLHPDIEHYIIVDLKPMLALSTAYLQRTMPGANITFIPNEELERVLAVTPDLVINIDSFQEMPPPVIGRYMTEVVGRAKLFYCKNPVGKYLPAMMGLAEVDSEHVVDAFSLGYCQNVIDIFDDDDLRRARASSLKAYCPPGWSVSSSKVMDLFPHYLHALYGR